MNLTRFSESKIALLVAVILMIVSGLSFVFWLVLRVLDGKGADLYKSHWGLSFSAIGVLILIGVCILVGFIGVYYSYQQSRMEKDLIKNMETTQTMSRIIAYNKCQHATRNKVLFRSPKHLVPGRMWQALD